MMYLSFNGYNNIMFWLSRISLFKSKLCLSKASSHYDYILFEAVEFSLNDYRAIYIVTEIEKITKYKNVI